MVWVTCKAAGCRLLCSFRLAETLFIPYVWKTKEQPRFAVIFGPRNNDVPVREPYSKNVSTNLKQTINKEVL